MYTLTAIASTIESLYADIDEALAAGNAGLAVVRMNVLGVLYDTFQEALDREGM